MQDIINILLERKQTISTMESCTGGALANLITNIPRSSEVFKFGAVTYSNEFKIKMGVKKEIIAKYSVYSMETAQEMSKNIVLYTDSDYGVGITGKLLRNDPYNKEGLINKVFICCYVKNKNTYYKKEILVDKETREENKREVLEEVIKLLKEVLNDKKNKDI